MMFLPSRDGWMTTLQEGDPATVMFTDTDDIAIVVDSIRAAAGELRIDAVRIWPKGDRAFEVTPRDGAE